jgi:hypothetical protein
MPCFVGLVCDDVQRHAMFIAPLDSIEHVSPKRADCNAESVDGLRLDLIDAFARSESGAPIEAGSSALRGKRV